MKRIAENRYPHSATLFKFCKEALALRYEGKVKVIDQDVGAILGYDPADCSHWKKGKKNIRSLTTLKSLADFLNIDEHLLIEIASGKIAFDEAVFEFKGYGLFALQGQNLEEIKKIFFKSPEKWQKYGPVSSFEELFNLNREAINKLADNIINTINFTEAPIYLPELCHIFSGVHMIEEPELTQHIAVEYQIHNDMMHVNIRYLAGQMRPHVRFLIAKELFLFLCKSKNELAKAFFNSPEELLEIQSNIFAASLLIPAKLLRKEAERIDCSLDVIQQLADSFWVSKSLMSRRLSDFMEYLT